MGFLLFAMVPVQVGVEEIAGSYHLVLVDTVEGRFLMMGISDGQALSIALGLWGQDYPRPLTHDLMLEALRETGWRVERVEVVDLVEGAYIANLVITNGSEKRTIDARPSDAVALAVRAGSPVYVDEGLLDRFMKDLLELEEPLPSVSI